MQSLNEPLCCLCAADAMTMIMLSNNNREIHFTQITRYKVINNLHLIAYDLLTNLLRLISK